MLEILKNTFYHFGFGIANALLGIGMVYAGIKSQKKKIKIILYNVFALFFALFAYETFDYVRCAIEHHPNNFVDVKFTGTFFDNPATNGFKKDLGYGPREDTCFCATATRHNKEELIYDVRYCLEKGCRKTPGNDSLNNKQVWFLGCSFVFGDGLNDSETLPFYFNDLSGGQYHIHNLGFSGYGTHQALKLVQQKIITNNLTDRGCVVYSFIPEHFLRAAGKAIWGEKGPWYEVENDTLVYKGTFEDKHFFKENYVSKRLAAVWHSSYLYRSVVTPKATEKDMLRVLAMVKTMQSQLANKGLKFYVLLTPEATKNTLYKDFVKKLKDSKINLFETDSIIPDLFSNSTNYFIKGDGHPNKNYNRKVAEFLVGKIKPVYFDQR